MKTEIKRLLRVRKTKSARFKREGVDKKKCIKDSWRRPRGIQSKQRAQKKAKGPLPTPGYGSPVAVRGMHPSGVFELLVFNPLDLENVDPTTHAVRIAASVGGRKRSLIQDAAAAAGIRVLNQKDVTLIKKEKPVTAESEADETEEAEETEETDVSDEEDEE